MNRKEKIQWLIFAAAVAVVSAVVLFGFLGAPPRGEAQETLAPTPPSAPRLDPTALRKALGIEAPTVVTRPVVAPAGASLSHPPAKPPIEVLPVPEDEHAMYLEAQRQRIAQEAQALAQLQAEIKREVERLEQVRGEIDQRLAQEDEATKKKLAKLVKIYEAMRPADLVKLLSDLDEPLRLQLLSRMKQKVVSQILALMDPHLAAETSKKLMNKKVKP
jgi:hypothetical protein